MTPRLGEFLGQQIAVGNRPGAGGQIGAQFVAQAAPDGYIILNVDTSLASNPSLYSKLTAWKLSRLLLGMGYGCNACENNERSSQQAAGGPAHPFLLMC